MERARKNNIWLSILKIITIIAVIVLIVFTSVYFLFKETLGINIFTISSVLKKIENPPDNMVIDEYDDKYIADTYMKVFGSDTIYSENENGYSFSMSALAGSRLTMDALNINAKELSAMLSVFPVTDNWFYGENQASLKEICFLDFEENTAKISVLAELDFSSIKENLSSGNAIEEYIKNKIPNKMYFTTYLNITKDEDAFSGSSDKIIVNNLSESESNEVLSLARIIFGLSSAKNLFDRLTTSFLDLAFNSSEAFFNSAYEDIDVVFIENEAEILLRLSKV